MLDFGSGEEPFHFAPDAASAQRVCGRTPAVLRVMLLMPLFLLLWIAFEVDLLPLKPPHHALRLWLQKSGNSILRTAELRVDSARDVVDKFNQAGFWSHGSEEVVSWTAMQDSMSPFIGEDFVYEFIYPWETKQRGLQGWYEGEFSAWNKGFPVNTFVPFIEVSSSEYVSYAAYMLSEWHGSFAGVGPLNRTVRVRDLDFYLVRDGKIIHN
eukprot:TRINITY_DN69187_c0_g1_i1.p1 TRINITY_DN69187_c0_g1~~TRINITY_DN69187_c0_g1_i1.p1  ORF type:complete len:218 (+),score=25.80 TRINITY_DN69187_c0_g1_i1:24-656(+)